MRRDLFRSLVKDHLTNYLMGQSKETLVQTLIETMSRKDLEQLWAKVSKEQVGST